ncbi:MAG: shikimate dehydrogenase [Gammaproteobacteria bacterium]|nr:shikimate dehydrogenase [Gammaproteobacteria bacterium]
MNESVDSSNRYAVVGNPVTHSLSPGIHQAFARQSGITLSYEALALPEDNFEASIKDLQQQGYKGLNVTVPFKQKAWQLCDRRSPRAEDSGAVNTIMFFPDGSIAGDNTDGVGLTRDLVKNNRTLIKRRRVLLLGAGGAVRGVVPSLLALSPDNLTVANRTLIKAEQLARDFITMGDINTYTYESLGSDKFDLIINGTSAGLNHETPPVPEEVLGINSICYDMMYNTERSTAFVAWAQNFGTSQAFDGLGMLVEQAAESFFIWHGIRVNTTEVIAALRHAPTCDHHLNK